MAGSVTISISPYTHRTPHPPLPTPGPLPRETHHLIGSIEGKASSPIPVEPEPPGLGAHGIACDEIHHPVAIAVEIRQRELMLERVAAESKKIEAEAEHQQAIARAIDAGRVIFPEGIDQLTVQYPRDPREPSAGGGRRGGREPSP